MYPYGWSLHEAENEWKFYCLNLSGAHTHQDSDNTVSKQRMLCEKWSIYFSTILMTIITLYSGLLPSLKTQITLIRPMYKNSWKKNRVFSKLG